MDTHVGFATVQPKNGTITIPAQLRRRLGLDRPGAQVEIEVLAHDPEGTVLAAPTNCVFHGPGRADAAAEREW